ncbi:uncharacterized protein METZ01_LOCUS358636, partial [marine metagenome]
FGGYIVGDICPVSCGSSPSDDPTGAYSAFDSGSGGCDVVLNAFGMSCDASFAGYTVGNICMTTCGTCGGSGPSGCDLPDMSLSVLEDGSVLYNTSASIGGFQFIVDGADLNGASGGDAEDVGFQISINPASGMVLAFSLTGDSIPEGCGTLVELDIEGTPTGLSDIILSDATGNLLDFSYYSPDSSTGSTPELFQFNQSTLQAFYFFGNVILNGIPIDSEDWVGAFNGDICVGAFKWDTSQCNNGICGVPAMGDDGNEYSEGYCTSGDAVTFKIYDASEDSYVDAYPSTDNPWANFGTYMIDSLSDEMSSIPG